MALLYIVDIKGDPQDLLAKYDHAGRAFEEKAAKLQKEGAPGVVAHICVETPDGIRILDLFESDTLESTAPAPSPRRSLLERGKSVEWLQMHGLVEENQRRAVRESGLLDMPYTETTYKVHDFTVLKHR